MIKHSIETQLCVDITHFGENPKIRKGKVLGEMPNSKFGGYLISDLAQKCGNAIGISLCDVVQLNLTKMHLNWYQNEVQSGSKLYMMTKGKLKYFFNKDLKLPVLQPIYVDMQKSELTWRFKGRQVGKLITRQDDRGWCLIEVDF